MTEKKNIAASVHQRLYNHAKNSGEDFNLLLLLASSDFKDLIGSLSEFFAKIIEAENQKQILARHWQKGSGGKKPIENRWLSPYFLGQNRNQKTPRQRWQTRFIFRRKTDGK